MSTTESQRPRPRHVFPTYSRKATTNMHTRRLVAIARHRNGSWGTPFYVVIFDESHGNSALSTVDRMIATVFDESAHVAVLNVAETAKGNIAFAEGNFEEWLREQIKTYEQRHI